MICELTLTFGMFAITGPAPADADTLASQESSQSASLVCSDLVEKLQVVEMRSGRSPYLPPSRSPYLPPSRQ